MKRKVLSFLTGALITALTLGAISALSLATIIGLGLNPPEASQPPPPPPPTRTASMDRLLGRQGPGTRTRPLPAPWATIRAEGMTRPDHGELPPGAAPRVLVQRRDPDRVSMLDAASGAVLWEFPEYRYDGASACNGRLFLRGWGLLEARDVMTGKVLWTHAEPRDPNGQPQRAFDAPTCDGELVVAVASAPLTATKPYAPEVIAFDAATGKPRWKAPLSGRGHSQLEGKLRHRVHTPTLIIHAGGPLQPIAAAFDRKTGARVWTIGEQTTGTYQVTPLGELLVFTNTVEALGVDVASGATLWSQHAAGATAPPVYNPTNKALRLHHQTQQRGHDLDPLTGKATRHTPPPPPRPLATLPDDLRPSCQPMHLSPAPRTAP